MLLHRGERHLVCLSVVASAPRTHVGAAALLLISSACDTPILLFLPCRARAHTKDSHHLQVPCIVHRYIALQHTPPVIESHCIISFGNARVLKWSKVDNNRITP